MLRLDGALPLTCIKRPPCCKIGNMTARDRVLREVCGGSAIRLRLLRALLEQPAGRHLRGLASAAEVDAANALRDRAQPPHPPQLRLMGAGPNSGGGMSLRPIDPATAIDLTRPTGERA